MKNKFPALISIIFLFLFLLSSCNTTVYAQTKLQDKKLPLLHKNYALLENATQQNLQESYLEFLGDRPQSIDLYYEFLLNRASGPEIEPILYLYDAINMKKFTSVPEVVSFLKERNPKLFAKDEIKGTQQFFKQLEKMLIQIELYEKQGLKANTRAKDFYIDRDGLKVEVPDHDYEKYLNDLNIESNDLEHKELKKFFQYLMSKSSLLEKTPYEDETDMDLDQSCQAKKKEIGQFANELVKFQSKAPMFPKYGPRDSSYQYDDSSLEFKSEMLYKMKLIASTVMNKKRQTPGKLKRILQAMHLVDSAAISSQILSKENLIFLLQQLLHTRHCNDAKRRVISEVLFPTLCEAKEKQLENKLYPQHDRYLSAYVLASQLKSEALNKLLQDKIDAKDEESITIRAATWDLLAKQLGLKSWESPYPRKAKQIFPLEILNYYTPEKLIQKYLTANSTSSDLEAGILSDFQGTKYKQFQSMADLLRFGLINLKNK